MRVRLLVGRVGNTLTQQPGDVIDLPDAEARALIASQQAVAIVEAAITVPPENGMIHRPLPRQAQRQKRPPRAGKEI